MGSWQIGKIKYVLWLIPISMAAGGICALWENRGDIGTVREPTYLLAILILSVTTFTAALLIHRITTR